MYLRDTEGRDTPRAIPTTKATVAEMTKIDKVLALIDVSLDDNKGDRVPGIPASWSQRTMRADSATSLESDAGSSTALVVAEQAMPTRENPARQMAEREVPTLRLEPPQRDENVNVLHITDLRLGVGKPGSGSTCDLGIFKRVLARQISETTSSSPSPVKQMESKGVMDLSSVLREVPCDLDEERCI